MNEIHSLTDKRIIRVAPGMTILQALQRARISQIHVCNCKARCTTCRVIVTAGLENCLARNAKEHALAGTMEFPDNFRLACQTEIKGHVTIRRPVVDELDMEVVLTQSKDAAGSRPGQEKDLAILFTDIENYTGFAESFPAFDVVHVLNRYYKTMNRIITANRGIISDVVGDGILAVFGISGRGNPVDDAVCAVREMDRAMVPFNRYLRRMFERSFGIRAGVHYGKVVVGTLVAGTMSKMAAIGDPVNIASRIEATNKRYGTRFLISETALEQSGRPIVVRRSFKTRLRGKSGSFLLHEIPLGSGSARKKPGLKT